MQQSTGESPFHLLHGWGACLPTETELTTRQLVYEVDIDDCRIDMVADLTEAGDQEWCEASPEQTEAVICSQILKFRVGDRVFVYMPSAKHGSLLAPFTAVTELSS